MKMRFLGFLIVAVGCSSTHPMYKTIGDANSELTVRVDHGPCFGNCPVYSLVLNDAENSLVYDGKKFTNLIGEYQVTLNEEEVAAIKMQLTELRFAELQDRYDGPVDDLPATTTTVDWGKGGKTVVNRMNGPQELRNFEQVIEALWEAHKSAAKKK